MSSPWNPGQYHRFRNERSQPFFDLLALVEPHPGANVVDLGCGTGELTKALHGHTSAAETVGIDNSETMLSRAAEFTGGGLRFELRPLQSITGSYDIVFSNAALQWLDNHEALLASLVRNVAPGGQLAFQVPANAGHPSHVIAHRIAAEEPFATALGGYVRAWPVLAPERYAELLYSLGFAAQTVRLQVYGHVLASTADVVEWVRGTLLTDYERRMSPELYQRYLARYRQALLAELGDRGPYFYAFNRILAWARKPA